MIRPQPHMRPLACPSARRRSRLSGPRRGERGIALLMAIALIAIITAAALISLRAVSTESALQAHERRGREAFFAAEAGMAEAREVLRLQLGSETIFDTVITNLGTTYRNRSSSPTAYVVETGLPSDVNMPWYEVIPWSSYTLTSTDAGTAVDPNVAGADREMNGPDGVRIAEYPEAANVRYRVFLVDDDDESASRSADGNGKVWLVSVGEVTGPAGTQPHRSIIRSLVTAGSAPGSGDACRDEGGSDNTGC